MTKCIRKTTSPVACIPLAMVILLSASAFAVGAGAGGAGDGHVGGPGISDLTSGTGSNGAAPGVVGGHRAPGSGVARGSGRRLKTVPARRQGH